MDQDACRQTDEQVDQRDDQTGDRVALDEFRRPVQRAVEADLALVLQPAALGLVVGDGARVQVAVDGQLLAGQ